MGVLNITPDSFSDGGVYFSPEKALSRVTEYIDNGVEIIDIGAQSTRPGAIEVGPDIEINRLKPVISLVRQIYPQLPLSVDTFHSSVASEAIALGVNWINDITGGKRDPDMFKLVSDAKCRFVITHSRGNSSTMDTLTKYNNVVEDVKNSLLLRTEEALAVGVLPENIIWDPGLGFAKTTFQNLEIVRGIESFINNKYPVLLGPSRKRFVGAILNEKDPLKLIWGSAAIACKCIQAGVSYIRVHDVYEIRKTILMGNQLWL